MGTKYTSIHLVKNWVGRRLGTLTYKEACRYLHNDEHLLAHLRVSSEEMLLCVDTKEEFRKMLSSKGSYTLYAVRHKEYLNF